MKRTFESIETLTCPHCGVKQTVFVHYYDESGQQVDADQAHAPGVKPGFTCAVRKCQKSVLGMEYYRVTEKTVGKG